MPKIAKAYAITNAKISFVSLVDKAANKKQFLITKSGDGAADFTTFGRIIKADADSHYVTGIVYEPMVEDTQGNYMTEEEITKAAYWFAKNGNQVDLQHCFEKCDGASVVESYVAKCDMEIEGQKIKKGTWLMTMEISDDGVWDSIQKGDITGFSMGGMGVYSEEDVTLPVEKNEESEGLLRKIAKAMGFDVVKKGAVKDFYNARVKSENFHYAWNALQNALRTQEVYNPVTERWEQRYISDEETITEALTDFNDIITQLLTSEGSIVKSLEKVANGTPNEVLKAGRSMSNKNLQTLQGISTSLSEFLSSFETSDGDGANSGGTNSTGTQNVSKKEENEEMNKEEVQKVVSEEIQKAMEPITQKLNEIAKGDTNDGVAEVTPESVTKMVGEEVQKAMEPIAQKLDAIAKSRGVASNLNDYAGAEVKKGNEEPHYMAGMF
jgi:hypothetical protein